MKKYQLLFLSLALVSCGQDKQETGINVNEDPAYRLVWPANNPNAEVSIGLGTNEVMFVLSEPKKVFVNDLRQEGIVQAYAVEGSIFAQNISAQAIINTSRSNIKNRANQSVVLSVTNAQLNAFGDEIKARCPDASCDNIQPFFSFSTFKLDAIPIADTNFAILLTKGEKKELANGVNVTRITNIQFVKGNEIKLEQNQELILIDKNTAKRSYTGHVTVVK